MLLRLLALLIIILLLLCLMGCHSIHSDTEMVVDGAVELTDVDLDKGIVRLDGTWAFYWSRFIDPGMPVKPDEYIEVPQIWNGKTIGGEPIDGMGYATYRALVKTSLPAGTQLGIRLFTFSSAYKLYIDDNLTAQNGVPAQTKQEEIGEYRPQVVYFEVPGEEFVITIHVSNFSYARGGFWYSAFLGKAQSIAALHDSAMQREAFLFGAIVLALLFHTFKFIIFRKQGYLIQFALFCIALLLGASLVGQVSLLRIFPVNFDTLVLLWYSSDLWIFFLLFLFIHTLYKSKLSSILMRIFLAITLIQQMVYLFTPVVFYTKYLADFASITNMLIITGAISSIIIGIRRKLVGGWLTLCGLIVAAISYVHDDLFWMNVINPNYGEVHHFGIIFFLLTQMAVQARIMYRENEDRLTAEFALRQAQIKPHFLYNALNTVISVSYDDVKKSRELLLRFANYLRFQFDFDNKGQMVSLENEIELSKMYIDIEQARFGDRLNVCFDIDVNTNINVPMLILQPIIENAINHGVLHKQEGGNICVTIKTYPAYCSFCVYDDGIGMDDNKIELIISGKCKGLALYNIHSRLKKLYGKGLSISGSKGCGLMVCWNIPLKVRK